MEVSAVGDLHADWVRELLRIPISATRASSHLKVMRGATTGDASWPKQASLRRDGLAVVPD
jgi:hypothetical protein